MAQEEDEVKYRACPDPLSDQSQASGLRRGLGNKDALDFVLNHAWSSLPQNLSISIACKLWCDLQDLAIYSSIMNKLGDELQSDLLDKDCFIGVSPILFARLLLALVIDGV
jgi:hypothetical protein